jgi:hypothetical protein
VEVVRPPQTRTPVVTHSCSNTNFTLETTTTSNDTPDIPVEPVTPFPQGIDVQEIVCQSLVRTQSALSRIRQPSRQINQLLDVINLQEQLQSTGLPENLLGGNITNPTKAPILGVEGSGILLEDWLLSLMSTLVMGFGPQD